MSKEIKITKTSNSKLSQLDFNNIPFGSVFTDHMFVCDYVNGEWQVPEIVPFSPMSIHPGNMALHYGQSVFEGMKAVLNVSGKPVMFRPDRNIERLNLSAERMCMPAFPEDLFLEGLDQLVNLEKDWIPAKEGSALYIRPYMFATEEALGVRPSKSYRFLILTLPVGSYYSQAVKLKADEKYIRAAIGGVGEAKTSGNYAASLLPVELAKKEGYDQVLWLDGKEFKYVQEVGTMNIFFVVDGTVLTPITDGAILKGITRDSILTILKDKNYKVEERHIDINEIIEAGKNGTLTEVFGAGTAAVIAPVSAIRYKEDEVSVDPEQFEIAKMLKETIGKIKTQEIEDKYDWVYEVQGELVSA